MEEDKEKTTVKHHYHRRLVFFPVPLQGHINPMIQLANILYKQGFTISIIHTKFNSIDQTKYPNFKFHQITDGISDATDSSISDVVLLLHKLNSNCVAPFQECLANLMSVFKDEEPVTCLITDTSWYFTQEVADSLKVPRIAFRTTSISSFLVFGGLPLFHLKGYLPKKDSELETEISDFWPLKVKDLPEFKSQDPQKAYQSITKILEITKASSGLIFNSFKELENNDLLKVTQQFHSRTFAIGPLHKYIPTSSSSSLLKQDRTAISWLNNQSPKSVLYISFGSLAVMDETELFEVALGLVNSMQHFLWVIRQNSQFQKYPDGFFEAMNQRGCIVKWAPQEEVLAHHAIGGFWTHCGWNSTLESICEGVPMICSPFFGDQMVNSRYVCDVWRVGLQLEKGLKSEEIEFAIRKLMVDEEGEEIRKNVLVLKMKSELCLQHGGSSYQSLKSLTDYVLSL